MRAVAVTIASLLVMPGVTLAEPTPNRAEHAITSSYRLQTLGADLAALVAFRFAERGRVPVELPIGSYVLGAPIIHAAHGRPGRAIASMGLRLILPIGGAAIGKATVGRDKERPEIAMIVFAIAGGALASLIDTVALAGGDPVTTPPRVAPSVQVTSHGATLGIGGAF